MRKRGHHRQTGARLEAAPRTNVLALVVPLRAGPHDVVVREFVAAAISAAGARDHALLLVTAEDGPAALRRAVSSSVADGVVLMDVEAADPRVPVLLGLGRPALLIGVPDRPRGLACLDLDFAAAGAACFGHLAGLGHEHAALIGSPPAAYRRGSSSATRLARGFTAEAARRGLRSTTLAWGNTHRKTLRGLDALFTRQPDVTAIVVHNETALPAVLAGLHERGLRVPEDISLVTVCPESLTEHSLLELTRVAIPARELGALAVETVIGQLDDGTAPGTRLLAPKLTVGASTAPPASPA
ncbi:LacI family DNA-binding transcriptional regulator [Amycolatopsis sp. Hca4]|uniref:LacI family DNA-binding transcriptional regulator n=1 Tax=Amycolatopsis sp. Hca4 TaxID=2742131 RepID=UPI0015906C9C|nr:LacI family DNA-binding transcriptional regulator [Amycolatopsis sp. Hca4]QKV79755.1 LacI family DNA-binding transcriptional regulator [Amycolatopsis sp. Hca4]